MPTVALYEEAKASTVALVASLSGDDLAQTCRACPAWSIQDVVAHHVHATGTHLNGGLPPVTYSAIVGGDEHERSVAAKERDDWTEAGVVARRGLPIAAVLAEWDDVVTGMDDRGAGMALDLVIHLDDIAETLGRPDPPSSPLRDSVLTGWYHAFVLPRLAGIRSTVDLLATDTGRRWGTGAAALVTGSSYDLLRTIASRRRRTEADRVIGWGNTPDATRGLLPVYGWPT
jgi:hypothetical protein